MATDAQAVRLQNITNDIEAMSKALKRAAVNIASLLQAGRATCDEVKAYNLWALATYDTQRGMLVQLRATGQAGVPALPATPMTFVWNNVQPAQAHTISCAGQPSSLKGAMTAALRGPDENTTYLGTDQVQIVMPGTAPLETYGAPTLAELQAQAAQGQLGAIGIPIIIAAILFTVAAAAVVAIMKYLETSEIQEANTKQTALQAEAFANYTAARLSCFSQCTSTGKTTEECTSICAKLIDKPEIKLPGEFGKWGALQWIGMTVVIGVGALVVRKVYLRRKAGLPIFRLPDVTY